MNKSKYSLVILFLTLIIFSLLIQPVIAENNKASLEFFHTTGCDICDEKKIIVNKIQQQYQNDITVKIYLVTDHPETELEIENHSIWKNYGFDYVPAIVIKNISSGNYTIFRYTEIEEQDVIDAIDAHLYGKPSETKVIDEKTPGFELILAILAITILLFYKKHK